MFQSVESKSQSCVSEDYKRNENNILVVVSYLYKSALVSILLLLFTANSASASGWPSPVNKGFFENEKSAFVLVPVTVGSVVGSVAGAGVGVPLSILAVIPATLSDGEPVYGLIGMYLGVAGGSAAMSTLIGAPFWAIKKLVYDLPFQ